MSILFKSIFLADSKICFFKNILVFQLSLVSKFSQIHKIGLILFLIAEIIFLLIISFVSQKFSLLSECHKIT